MRKIHIILLLLLLFLPGSVLSIAHASILTFKDATLSNLQHLQLIDARNLTVCQSSSVTDAYCLPAQTFQSETGELASFRDIFWALGTADLNESDGVLVFSDDIQQRDAVAGILFLAGQQQVWLWPGTVTQLQQLLGSEPGQLRGLTRSKIYMGMMRDEFIVLESEIAGLHKAGWQLVQASPVAEMEQQLIVSAATPLASIALFASLISTGHQKVKLVVDRFDIKQNEKGHYWLWPGLLFFTFLALLIAFIVGQKNRGKQ